MKETNIATYLDSNDGADLVPSRTRLLFSAWIDHGPGSSEKAEYRIGPSNCGRFDVLWISSDFGDGETRNAAAWIPRHQMIGKALQLALLEALFAAEKAEHDLDEPNFSEVAPSPRAALSDGEVRKLADKVFSNPSA
jgi:hypothetical protein